MIPVYLSGKNGREGISFDDFERKFLSICNFHHQENRALAFAFILCDFTHAEIFKILNDPDYWNALNQISGNFLTIFSFHLSRRHHQGTHRPFQRSDSLTFEAPHQFIKEQFGIDLPIENPMILFFQVKGDQVTDSVVVAIRSQKIQTAFLEIRSVLLDVVDSVKKVETEHRKNTTEIFNLISARLSQRKAISVLKKTLQVVGSVQEAANKIKGF